jgi:hypothetical protein
MIFSNPTTYASLIPWTEIERTRPSLSPFVVRAAPLQRRGTTLLWRRRRRTAGAEQDGLRDTAEEGHQLRSWPGDLEINWITQAQLVQFCLEADRQGDDPSRLILYFLIFANVSDARVTDV